MLTSLLSNQMLFASLQQSPRNAHFSGRKVGQGRHQGRCRHSILFFSCPLPNSGNVRSNCEICGRMDEKQFWQFTFLSPSHLARAKWSPGMNKNLVTVTTFVVNSLCLVRVTWSKDKACLTDAEAERSPKLCWMVVIYRNCSILPFSLSFFSLSVSFFGNVNYIIWPALLPLR